MSYQVIARKYRPQRFEDIIGQEHITKTLQNAITAGRLHHAYLFTGIRGIGKTTLARIFSKILNCKEPQLSPFPDPCNKCQSCNDITNGSSIDVQEIDGASNTGVDDVREIRERVKFLPVSGKYKIYIIDEVHMLSTAAFNALLKTLEEPPAHVIFILATTEAHKIPATILSRCQRYDFRRIPVLKIVETLREIAKTENVTADDVALEVIAEEAEGSMRDAESLFDQAIAYSGKNLTVDHLKELLGFLDQKQLAEIVRAIISKDSAKAIAISDELFKSGENLTRFASQLLDLFHGLLIAKSCKGDISGIKKLNLAILKEIEPKVTLEECQQWFNIIYKGIEDLARTKFPKTIFDVMLINMTVIRPVVAIDRLIERLDSIQSTQNFSSQPQPRQVPQSTPVISGSFSEFLEWLKLNKPQVASFMEMSVGGDVKDSVLTVLFQNKSFASDRLLEDDRKAFFEKLASDFFKKPMSLMVKFSDPSEDAVVVAKKKSIEEGITRQKTIKDEALKHDIVKEAASIFNAEIKEIKIKG
jgi:DNA polymerase-3 subunit gamma/tau